MEAAISLVILLGVIIAIGYMIEMRGKEIISALIFAVIGGVVVWSMLTLTGQSFFKTASYLDDELHTIPRDFPPGMVDNSTLRAVIQ
jgi:hypothetical protein